MNTNVAVDYRLRRLAEYPMAVPRKIVDARSDSDGRTSHVLLEGNTRFISAERAKPMVERGEVAGAHLVKPKGRDSFIRTNPDGAAGNNLDRLCGDR